MGRSEKEGSPIQPDGSLLSLVGDLLFAGAILIMIYPCIRKTVSRLDGQFFRQFFHIVEILLAVAVLSFVLMLLIGQQMRIAYCSFIRPYMGESDEDKAYIGVLLKFLVCLLLLLNYFCASGLQKLVGFITERFQQPVPVPQERLSRHAATPHMHYAQYGDALTNNSNTNSQTPVTQTQSVMQSDILSYMSFPQLSPEPYPEPAASRQGPHSQYRDVGTMVRFPVAEYQHCNQCTLHFCPAQCPRPSTAPPTVLYSSLPSTTISNMPHSPFVETRTSQSMYPGEASSHHMPARIPNQTGRGPEVFHADSSCHFVLNPPSQMSFGPGAYNSIYSSASRAANRCNACRSERRGQGGGGMESDPPSSCYSSDYTSSDSSSRESNQSSFLSSLGLTSVPRSNCDQGSREAASVESTCHTDQGPACGHTPSSNAAHLATPGCQTSPESTSAQRGGRRSPVTAQSGFCLSHSSTLAVSSPVFGSATCSVSNASPVTNLSGALVPTYVHSTSPPVCCLRSPKPLSSPQQFHHVCSPTPPPSASRTSTASTRLVRRRQLPPMPKMTRSGKIYGYG